MSGSVTLKKEEYDLLLKKLEELTMENEALKKVMPASDSYIYLLFDPREKTFIYGGKGTMLIPDGCFREIEHCKEALGTLTIQKGGKPSEKHRQIKKAFDEGGIGMIRLKANLMLHEASGAEAAMLTFLKGKSTNKNRGSVQGSYSGLSLDELKKCGQKMVEDGLKNWCESGRKIWTEKTLKDYSEIHIVKRLCRSGKKCSKPDVKVPIGVTGYCMNCEYRFYREQKVEECTIYEGEVRCTKTLFRDGRCKMHFGRKRLAAEYAKRSIPIGYQARKGGNGIICPACKKKIDTGSIRIKYMVPGAGGSFYHSKCFHDLEDRPEMSTEKFEGFDQLKERDQVKIHLMFPDIDEDENAMNDDEPEAKKPRLDELDKNLGDVFDWSN